MMTVGQAAQERHLFVSWRDPEVGSIHPIGRLVRRSAQDGESYSFAYLKNAERLERFDPLPGLPQLHERYDSQVLFPVFANRVMPRSRPDYDMLASRVDLAGDADPFEVLARSGVAEPPTGSRCSPAPSGLPPAKARCCSSSVASVIVRPPLKQCPLSSRAIAWSLGTTKAMRIIPGPCFSVSATASRSAGPPTISSNTSTSFASSTVRIPS